MLYCHYTLLWSTQIKFYARIQQCRCNICRRTKVTRHAILHTVHFASGRDGRGGPGSSKRRYTLIITGRRVPEWGATQTTTSCKTWPSGWQNTKNIQLHGLLGPQYSQREYIRHIIYNNKICFAGINWRRCTIPTHSQTSLGDSRDTSMCFQETKLGDSIERD